MVHFSNNDNLISARRQLTLVVRPILSTSSALLKMFCYLHDTSDVLFLHACGVDNEKIQVWSCVSSPLLRFQYTTFKRWDTFVSPSGNEEDEGLVMDLCLVYHLVVEELLDL